MKRWLFFNYSPSVGKGPYSTRREASGVSFSRIARALSLRKNLNPHRRENDRHLQPIRKEKAL